MDTAQREKINVVVIHGVGETEPGWIDQWLVPHLEKWRAFDSVTKPESAAKAKPQQIENKFVFVAHAYDMRPVAVVLEDDEVFKNFCDVAFMNYCREQFATKALRAAKRDELQNEITQAFSSKFASASANEWLQKLQFRGVPSTIAFEPESIVRRVRDPEDSVEMSTWTSFTRRCSLDDRNVSVTELYWADLSKVGYTITERFSALLQLFLEAPDVLGRTFLSDSRSGLSALVRRIMLTANWVMRWPISGLHTAIFVAAFAAIVLQQTHHQAWLPQTVAGALAFVAVTGYQLSRKFLHGKIGLSDLSLSASVHAVLLLGVLALSSRLASPAALASPELYLTFAVTIILIAWLCWTMLIALAIVLLAALAFQKLVWRLLLNRRTGPPIVRPAAAIGISILTGNFWKFVLATLGLFIISTLVGGSAGAVPSCTAEELKELPAAMSAGTYQPCMLSFAKNQLKDVVALNGLALALIALAAGIVVFVRLAMKKIYRARAEAGTLRLPRLIASPLIILTLFATALTNAYVFYIHPALDSTADAHVRYSIRQLFRSNYLEQIGTGALGLILFYFLMVNLLEKSNGVIHIGRDLVDHQYDPKDLSLAMWIDRGIDSLKTMLFKLVPAGTAARLQPADDGNAVSRFRRRQRIQRRLEALIDEVIAGEKSDRLIFAAHSQGTVIMYDYLTNHDGLISLSHSAVYTDPITTSIDVLTLGSPLKHIYRYYYPGYDEPGTHQVEHPPLMSKVRSWTNMFRIDDPIGQDVDLHDGIVNIGIGPGGHTDYWKEHVVCQKIWDMIVSPPATAVTAAPAASVAA